MVAIAPNPGLLVTTTIPIFLLGWQFLPAKVRSDPGRVLLCGFGVAWLVVLFVETTGRTRLMLLAVVLAVLAVFGGFLRWKMVKESARRDYGRTKMVFDDPDGGPASGVVPPPMTAAGWFADTTSRHQLRYWDGSRWTENVADNGATTVDPVT